MATETNGPQTPPHDPSVIVGLACRVPGANNPSQLWDSIVEKRDVRRKMPEDRFLVDNFYHSDNAHKGTVSFNPCSTQCAVPVD